MSVPAACAGHQQPGNRLPSRQLRPQRARQWWQRRRLLRQSAARAPSRLRALTMKPRRSCPPLCCPRCALPTRAANKLHQEGGSVCPICVCSLLLESACHLLSMTWRTTVDLALRLQEALTMRPRRSCPPLCCPRCAGKVLPSQFQMQERNLSAGIGHRPLAQGASGSQTIGR